jgi:DNA-binding MarR family transcriptional regulator
MTENYSRLWLTCRVIANKNRLQLLGEIFSNSRLCVRELALIVGLTPATTSNQLKLLCDKGFIAAHRSGLTVFYDTDSTDARPHILQLQTALKKSWTQSVPWESVIHQATGLTHQRRIELVKRIAIADELSINQLLEDTVMSYSALHRHLHKLEARNYITFSGGTYRLAKPKGLLARSLLKLIG